MRYSITSQQLDYMRKEGSVEFAGFYSEEKTEIIQDLIEKEVSETGRDLQRTNLPLSKALHPSKLGQIASQLYHKKQIRIAFTQLLPCFSEPAALSEIASVTEVFGGATIDLNTGDASFYTPEALIDFETSNGKLLIAFTTGKGRYIIQPKDPHTHYLKKLGYAAGDRLTDETHPLIHK